MESTLLQDTFSRCRRLREKVAVHNVRPSAAEGRNFGGDASGIAELDRGVFVLTRRDDALSLFVASSVIGGNPNKS